MSKIQWADKACERWKVNEAMLQYPFRWRKPRHVLVDPINDLFHEAVPFEFIDRVFAVMSLCPQHAFQVLTKRPERMAEYLNRLYMPGYICDVAAKMGRPLHKTELKEHADGVYAKLNPIPWPLPNVWLGTSAEDQARLDERVPHLLKCPAAVRFLSLEPLLGPVDLTRWDALGFEDGNEIAKVWAEYRWPAWVPQKTRDEIGRFWSAEAHRNPAQWKENANNNKMPSLGANVGLDARNWVVPGRSPEAVIRGRFVPCWGNFGRVVTDDGVAHFVSTSSGRNYLQKFLDQDGKYRHRLHWIIVGGESGPGARACDVAWIRSVVHQCKTAEVPCFVKQFGSVSYRAEPTWNLPNQRGVRINLQSRSGSDPAEWPEDLRVREWPGADATKGGNA